MTWLLDSIHKDKRRQFQATIPSSFTPYSSSFVMYLVPRRFPAPTQTVQLSSAKFPLQLCGFINYRKHCITVSYTSAYIWVIDRHQDVNWIANELAEW